MMFYSVFITVRKYLTANYRRLLLSFSLSLALLMLVISLISFLLVFSQAKNILENTSIYEYVYTLSSSLKDNQNQLEEWLQDSSFATKKFDIQSSLPKMYGTIEYMRLIMQENAGFGMPLLRGIENGLSYIRQKIIEMNEETDEVAKYAQAQHILQTYSYLIRYVDGDILSGYLAINVTGIEQALSREKIYRIAVLAGIFFILLVYVFFSFRITKKLTSPIENMVKTASEISKGNLDIPDLTLSNTSEIRLLEETINKMKLNLKKDIQMMEEKAALTTELDAARLSALQAQIHPHFLFNTLNIINRTATQEQAEKTQELIHALSGIFRYNLEYKKTVYLQDEIDFIEQYMHIQQSRFSDRLTYVYTCNCDISNVVIPPFTLQPFVENAVIHGLSESEDGGEVSLEINQEKKKLKLCISDTGVGATEKQIRALMRGKKQSTDANAHIGVQNVINRLQLYYKKKAQIRIEQNVPKGFKVVVLIPYEENINV